MQENISCKNSPKNRTNKSVCTHNSTRVDEGGSCSSLLVSRDKNEGMHRSEENGGVPAMLPGPELRKGERQRSMENKKHPVDGMGKKTILQW